MPSESFSRDDLKTLPIYLPRRLIRDVPGMSKQGDLRMSDRDVTWRSGGDIPEMVN